MLYEELHQRYGSHIARRVHLELTASEFEEAPIDALVFFLEARAEAAHQKYQSSLARLVMAGKTFEKNKMDSAIVHQRWRDAEDLAYLVSVAEDVGAQVRAVLQK